MKALISPQENNCIAEVSEKDFPIAFPLYWVDCPSNCTTEWSFDGINFNEPVIPTPESPSIVSMRQARLALLQVDLLNSVEEAIANGSKADQITWEYATEVRRDDSLVVNLSVTLGLSKQQLDDLFTLASTL